MRTTARSLDISGLTKTFSMVIGVRKRPSRYPLVTSAFLNMKKERSLTRQGLIIFKMGISNKITTTTIKKLIGSQTILLRYSV